MDHSPSLIKSARNRTSVWQLVRANFFAIWSRRMCGNFILNALVDFSKPTWFWFFWEVAIMPPISQNLLCVAWQFSHAMVYTFIHHNFRPMSAENFLSYCIKIYWSSYPHIYIGEIIYIQLFSSAVIQYVYTGCILIANPFK